MNPHLPLGDKKLGDTCAHLVAPIFRHEGCQMRGTDVYGAEAGRAGRRLGFAACVYWSVTG